MITRKRVGSYPSTLVDKAVRLWWAGAICLVLAVASILWVCYHAMPLWASAPGEDDELAANAKALKEYDWIVYWKTNDRPAESPNEAISHDPHPNSSPDDPYGSGNSGPMKIFPCKKTYDDQYAPLRRYVLAVVEYKLGESPPAEMYFRLWDVDDPSADGPPIDTRPKVEPGTKGPDNWVPNKDDPVDQHKIASESDATKHFTVAVPRGYVIRFKEDGSWEQKPIGGDNADRLYMVEVMVGMQPGDNYRFTASPELANLLEPKYKQENADAAQLPDNGRISKKLTVWRKLHLEVDAMQADTNNTNKRTGTLDAAAYNEVTDQTDLEVESVPGFGTDWDVDDAFNGGWIKVQNEATSPWEVVDFDANTNDDNVFVTGNHTSANGKTYLLGDDDYDNVGGNLTLKVSHPRDPNTEWLESRLAKAYVEPKLYRDTGDSSLTFNRNLYVGVIFNPWGEFEIYLQTDFNFVGQDCRAFWVSRLVSAHQPGTAVDNDPNSESVICGAAVGVCTAVFLETTRDAFVEEKQDEGADEKAVVVHEIGHTLGANDITTGRDTAGVMYHKIPLPETWFNDQSLDEIRKNKHEMAW